MISELNLWYLSRFQLVSNNQDFLLTQSSAQKFNDQCNVRSMKGIDINKLHAARKKKHVEPIGSLNQSVFKISWWMDDLKAH